MLQVSRAMKLLCDDPCLWLVERAVISHAAQTPLQGHMPGACYNKNNDCRKDGHAGSASSHVLPMVLRSVPAVVVCGCWPRSCKHDWESGKRGSRPPLFSPLAHCARKRLLAMVLTLGAGSFRAEVHPEKVSQGSSRHRQPIHLTYSIHLRSNSFILPSRQIFICSIHIPSSNSLDSF